MIGDTRLAIARWVRRHPKIVRSAIRAVLVAARNHPLDAHLFAEEARRIRRGLLLARLRAIDGVRYAEVIDVVGAYLTVVAPRRQATNDPLEMTFDARLGSLVDLDDDPDDKAATYEAWLRLRFRRRRRLARRQDDVGVCTHAPVVGAPWRPCSSCAAAIRWAEGEFFASVDGSRTVLFGEVLHVITEERLLVRMYPAFGPSHLDEYGASSKSVACRLTREQMDRAANLGWPRSIDTLRAILESRQLVAVA